MAEQKKRFPGFVGPSYTSRVKRFDAQRTVNYYIELDETGGGKGGEPATLIGTPGLRFLQQVGNGPIRGMHVISNQQLAIIVSGNEVYQLSGAMSIPVVITGNLTTSVGPVSIEDNGYEVVIVDGQNGYTINLDTPAIVQISEPNFYPCTTVSYQDGYFLFSGVGTNEWFISEATSSDEPYVTFGPNNIAAKSGNSDILIAAISNNRQVYLFGANDMEIWFNAGAGIFPFLRQDGRFSQVGCSSAASIQVLGETLFWLGSNSQGGGVIYMLENAMPKRISTHAVEYAIQKYTNLQGATAFAYQQEGHYFYCLTIPGANTTWVYDMSNGQWTERQSTENGITGRHLADTHCVLNNMHILGDYRNGNIYEYDLETYTDNNEMVIRIRQSPHISEVGFNLFYKLLEIDFQFGTGLEDNGVNTSSSVDPKVALQISNDGGQTWGNPIMASIGRMGRWLTRARFARLGYSRDRVFRVISTEPVKTQMLAAWLDVEKGFG